MGKRVIPPGGKGEGIEVVELKKALEVAKETLALIAEGEGSDESVYMTMGKSALAKIKELEKK